MTKVSCSIPERFVNPLFEVFDGGDFILSSYRDIEKPLAEMRIYLEDAAQAEAAKKALKDALEIVLGAAREGTRRTDGGTDGRAASTRPPQITVEDVPDEDWKFAYRRHFKTEQVSPRIFTVPEWEAEDFFASGKLAEGQIAIVSDPGMAFGTGKHETTKACLMYVDELVREGGGRETRDERRERKTLDFRREASTSNLQPSTFLDMGTGSGILAIAAAKLGCAEVVGFDVDPEAVAAARENAAKNGVKIRFEQFALGRSGAAGTPHQRGGGIPVDSGCGKLPHQRFAPADLVVANILGPLLIRFADEIAPYVKRHLVISGILTTLYPEVRAAYVARGFAEISHKTIGEWTTGLLVVRPAT